MSNLVGLNVGLSDSLSEKTRRYADYYRQLAAGTIKNVYDNETVSLSSCFYRSSIETANFPVCKSLLSPGTFIYCQNLSSVYFPVLGGLTQFSFSETPKLTSILFPEVKLAEKGAIKNSSIVTADLPACKEIKDDVFEACKKLEEIKIPVCTSIGARAFINCDALKKIFLDGVTAVPALGHLALNGTPATLKIIVPDALVESFKAATGWSAYADKIVGISEYNAAT